MDEPLLIGVNSKVRLTLDTKQFTVLVDKSSIKPNITKIEDHICGEDRARLGRIINFYDITLACKLLNPKPLLALFDYQDNEDAQQKALIAQLGILITPPGGSRVSIVAREIVIDDWSWAFQNRSDRQTLDLPLRAKYIDNTATL